MKIFSVLSLLVIALFAAEAVAQKDAEIEPTAVVNFVVLKEDNGKPIRNAAVIMHPVSSKGKQGRGDLELKSDAEGKSTFDGIPYGKLRVQVLASGFQTYGEDVDVDRAKMEFTIKLKRPQGQYSIYDDHSKDVPQGQATPPEKKSEKPD